MCTLIHYISRLLYINCLHAETIAPSSTTRSSPHCPSLNGCRCHGRADANRTEGGDAAWGVQRKVFTREWFDSAGGIPHGEFKEKVQRAALLEYRTAANLMTLARHRALLEEKKVMATRYGALMGNPQKSEVPQKSQGRKGAKSWFVVWYEVTGLTRDIAERMWDEFKTDVGLTITPGNNIVGNNFPNVINGLRLT